MDDMGDMERNQVEVMDLVLTILEYHAPTEDEEKTFLSAADAGKTLELESMLQLPMDPNGFFVSTFSPFYFEKTMVIITIG